MPLPFPLHLSFGLIKGVYLGVRKALAWLRDTLGRVFMLPTYRRSHVAWMKRNSLGARWTPLWDGVEYDISFPHPAYPEPRVCRAVFRALETPVRSAEMILEVHGSGIRYQEHIRLQEINAQPIVVSLRSVPELDIERIGGNFSFSVEGYGFLSGRFVSPDGQAREHGESLRHSLIQNWMFNDAWVHRWGHWWNGNEIMRAKGLIAEYWRFRFGFRTWQSAVLGNTLGISWVVTVQFWVAVASMLFVLSPDGELQLRWQQVPVQEQAAG